MQLITSPTMSNMSPESGEDSLPSMGTTESPDLDDYGGFDLLEDMDEDHEEKLAA